MRLDINQILFLESQKHNVLIHSEQGDFITQGPMKRMEELLTAKGFSKCHNPYLVNLNNVIAIQQIVTQLKRNYEILISRPRKKGF